MGADRVASLPMYDFPELREAQDVFWNALAERIAAAGVKDVPRKLTRGAWPAEVWGDSSLLFAQGCEYPLAKAFGDRVRVVAHPVYLAAGCEGARYRSAVVVRGRAAPGGGDGGAGVAALAALRGRRCVVNELDSKQRDEPSSRCCCASGHRWTVLWLYRRQRCAFAQCGDGCFG